MTEEPRKYNENDIEIGKAELDIDTSLNHKKDSQVPESSISLSSKRKVKWGLVIPIILILLVGIGFAIGEIFDLGSFRDIFFQPEVQALSLEEKHGAYFDEVTISREVTPFGNGGEIIKERKVLASYTEVRNVEEDGEWKKIENARSLMNSSIKFKNIKTDSRYGYEIQDFNYTSISFYPVLNDNKELNKDISIKKDEVVKKKFNYDNLNQRQEITFYGDILNSNFTVGDNSTVFQVSSSNEITAYSGLGANWLGRGDSVTEPSSSSTFGTTTSDSRRAFVNFSLSQLPVGAIVLRANFSFKITTVSDFGQNYTIIGKNASLWQPTVSNTFNGFEDWRSGDTTPYNGNLGLNVTNFPTSLFYTSGNSGWYNLSITTDGNTRIQQYAGKDFRIAFLSECDLQVCSASQPATSQAIGVGDDFTTAPILFIEYDTTTINPSNPIFTATINSTDVRTNNTNVNLTIKFVNQDSSPSMQNITMNWYENESAMLVLNMPFITNSTDVKDYSGYNNNGTISGAVWNNSCSFNNANNVNCYQFNGKKNSINVTQINTTGAFTFEAWINPRVNYAGVSTIYDSFSTQRNKGEFMIRYRPDAGNVFNFFRYSSQGSTDISFLITANTITPNGNWYHIVAVYTGENIASPYKFYINNVLDTATNTSTTTTVALGVQTRIGLDSDNSNQFNGSIASVRIWNRSLSANQIFELYNSYNKTYFNLMDGETTTGFTYRAQVTVANSTGLGNLSISTNNITILGTQVSFSVNPFINSTYGNNITNETLFVTFTPSSLGGSSQKANITWFSANESLQFRQNVTTNGLSLTEDILTVSSLHDGNTTKNQYWLAMVTLYDGGTAIYMNTSNLLIRNYNPYPPNLNLPAQGYLTANYTINLSITNSSDLDNDIINYEFWLEREVTPPTVMFGNTTMQSNITSLGQDGTYYWRARANDGQNVSIFTDTRTFLVDRRLITENITTFMNPALQGSSQVLSLNITFNRTTVFDVNGTLIYNNTIYNATRTNYKDNGRIFTQTVITPLNATARFFWNLTITLNNATLNYNSSYSYFHNLIQTNLTNCSGSNPNQAIAVNFSIRDEVNETQIRGSFEGTFVTWVNDRGVNITTKFLQNDYMNVTNVLLCISPPYVELLTEAETNYISNGFQARQYYFRNDTLNNQTKAVGLYLLHDSISSAVNFKITDSIGNPLADYIFKVLLHDIGNNTLKTIAMGKADFDGNDLIYLRKNNPDAPYRFSVIDKLGKIIFTSLTDTKIVDDIILRISSGGDITEILSVRNGITKTLSFDSGTSTYTYSFNDPSGKTLNSVLKISRTSALEHVDVLTRTLSGSSGSTTFTLPINSTGTYTATAFVNIDVEGTGTGFGTQLITISNAIDTTTRLFSVIGRDGILATVFLIVTFAMLSATNSTLVIIFSLIGLMFSVFMGIIEISTWVVTTLIIVIGGIMFYKIKN